MAIRARVGNQVGRFHFAASPGAFLQVNTPAAEVLYNAAKDAVKDDAQHHRTSLEPHANKEAGLPGIVFKIAGALPSAAAAHHPRAKDQRDQAINTVFSHGVRGTVS